MAVSIPSLLLTAGQGILGAIQADKGDERTKALLRKRKAFQTPEEIFDILQATESRASTGYDPATLSYLTGETDRAFNSSLETARLLGADPNTLGAAFDQKVTSIMKIGAENHALNLENFNRYLGAKELVAANDAAEQKSKQDLLKDDIQAAVADKQAGVQNVGNAINSTIGLISAGKTEELYKDRTQAMKEAGLLTGTNPVTSIERVPQLEKFVPPTTVEAPAEAGSNTEDMWRLFQEWMKKKQPNLNRR